MFVPLMMLQISVYYFRSIQYFQNIFVYYEPTPMMWLI